MGQGCESSRRCTGGPGFSGETPTTGRPGERGIPSTHSRMPGDTGGDGAAREMAPEESGVLMGTGAACSEAEEIDSGPEGMSRGLWGDGKRMCDSILGFCDLLPLES